MSKSVREITEELVLPILEEMQLELVDIEYVKEGTNWFLRIYIDKESGIEIAECGKVSELLSVQLDKEDPIKEAYFLEVSSPGVERPLKKKEDFIEHMNGNVNVRLYEHIDGSKEYEGIIKMFEDDLLTIEYRDRARLKEVKIPYEKIAKARRAVSF